MMPMKDSFADLMNKGAVALEGQRHYSTGMKLQVTIAHIGSKHIVVDLDRKQQGIWNLDTSIPENLKVGDTVNVSVINVSDGVIYVGQSLQASSATSDESLMAAWRNGMPVQGKVALIRKGGATVEIGKTKAFCPVSQLSNHYVTDPNTLLGQTLTFLISEIKEGGDTIVSRKMFLEREEIANRKQRLANIKVGDVVTGKVTQARDFGVFVDLNGLEGLIPQRELSYEKVKATELFNAGDLVEVQIKEITEQDGEGHDKKPKITLSIKSLQVDPWQALDAIAPTGKVISGQVVRVEDFGAFVRVAEGVDGLLHVSELKTAAGVTPQKAGDAVAVGDHLLTVVAGVDLKKRRIELKSAPKDAAIGSSYDIPKVSLGSIVDCVVDSVETFGVFASIQNVPGRAGRGLIPQSELGVQRGADLRKEFPVGKALKAKVIEAHGGKLKLSIRAAANDAEAKDFQEYRQKVAKESSMGTLGDLFKKK